MTSEELKKRVMKYLNKNGDTFCSITSQLLNSGMSSTTFNISSMNWNATNLLFLEELMIGSTPISMY